MAKYTFHHLLAFVFFTILAAPCFAQPESGPLKWGIDIEGGLPYFFKNPDNPSEYIGFEVDLVKALEKELGRKIEITHCSFDMLIAGLNNGDFDFAMNGLEITPDRRRIVRFCRPYYIYKLQLVARDNDPRIQSLAACKGKDFEIATLETTAAEKLLDAWKIPKALYDNQTTPFMELQKDVGAGKDAVLIDVPIANFYAKTNATNRYALKMKGMRFVGEPLAPPEYPGYYGIAVQKANEELALQLNAALDRLLANGELERIYKRWDIWNDDQKQLPSANVEDVPVAEGPAWTLDEYFPLLLDGAVVTVIITFASMALAVIIGLIVAIARMYGGPFLSFLAVVYVEFFRGVPVLLLLYFMYYGVPSICRMYGLPFTLNLDPWTAAILGLGLNYAAYEAEIYRSSITAIPKGQWEAAASLGMSGPLTFRRIILPQAIRGILPPMTNDFVALFKDTSLVSVIAVVELNKRYQILTKSGGDFLEIGLTTALLYLIMSVPLGHLSRYLEKRWGNSE